MKGPDLLTETTYYLLVCFLVLFTASIAFLLTPVFLLGNLFVSAVITIIVGLSFGLFTSSFIKMLDQLTKHHHAGIWAIVGLGAIFSFTAIFLYASSERLAETLGFTPLPNPFFVGALFALSFLLPHLLMFIEEHKKK